MGKRKEENTNFLSEMLFVLRKNLILMLIIVLIAGIIGVVVTTVRKPEHIVKQSVNYYVETNSGTPNTTAWFTSNINYMSRYVDTVIAFCQTEKVLDRAESYYTAYKNDDNAELKAYLESENGDEKRAFVAKEVKDKNNSPILLRDKTKPNIEPSRIKTYAYSKDDMNTSYVFAISYQDEDDEEASRKAKLIILAAAVEGSDFFSGVKTVIEDIGEEGRSIDIENNKIILLSLILGAALAVIIVYVKNAMDFTLKSKDDLEELTGASVFACINKREFLEINSKKKARRGK